MNSCSFSGQIVEMRRYGSLININPSGVRMRSAIFQISQEANFLFERQRSHHSLLILLRSPTFKEVLIQLIIATRENF